MSPSLQPTWLEADTDVAALVRPPAYSPWLLASVLELIRAAATSPTSLHVRFDDTDPTRTVRARVAALTQAPDPDSAERLTLVVFHLERSDVEASALRALVERYAADFSRAKWRATRWFVQLGAHAPQELKLQSERRGNAWFLQTFDLPPTDVPTAGS